MVVGDERRPRGESGWKLSGVPAGLSGMTEPIAGVAAGVPYTALPPPGGAADAPLIVAWHLMDPPCTDAAMAAALPMREVPAWRVYLGLPMTGRRALPGGFDELMRLGYQDAVLNLFAPVSAQASAEAPAAVAEVRARLGIPDGPVGVLGGSLGSMVALEVAATGSLPVAAGAIVSSAVRLTSIIEANEVRFGTTYEWSERSRAAATRLDYVARAGEIAARRDARGGPPPFLVLTGQEDAEPLQRAAEELASELAAGYPDDTAVRLVNLPGVAHNLAEPPGEAPAPQTDSARLVDAELTAWFRTHLKS
ncbi:prolyl oligopeptidase family serine peptidase [Pseudonocardia eucalypti]|uniref:Prolyl oligopeptidase family serine peptidase n=2 Tax=Pseudonocardia eucalypti TaxID=648755 RepID=A0ABP9QEI9_9PSEU